MSIRILNPGLLSSLQDLGRFGYQASGFSPAGAADSDALMAANLLVGNEPGEAAVEMNLKGMEVVFGSDCVIALTGGNMSPCVNDEPVPMYRALCVKKDDRLTCGYASTGIRTYLAVNGGFDVPVVMGSRSTGLKFSVGGYQGRAFRSDDVLKLRHPQASLPGMERRTLPVPEYPSEVTLRAVPGPQADKLGESAVQTFFSELYTVSNAIDRMGIRLDGRKIPSADGYDIISDGTGNGTVQISNDGTPIILLNDRQTTGGYAKLAAIISADLPATGQLRPGTHVRFEEISVVQAEKAARRRWKEYRKLYCKINGFMPGKR